MSPEDYEVFLEIAESEKMLSEKLTECNDANIKGKLAFDKMQRIATDLDAENARLRTTRTILRVAAISGLLYVVLDVSGVLPW